MNRFIFWGLLFWITRGLSLGVAAQEDVDKGLKTKRVYETNRFVGEAPEMDGLLNDAVWDQVPWAGEFVQHEPDQKSPASYQTQFKILYDDKALYFAIQLEDDPALMSSLLARRDYFPGDWVEINIDSYGDRRTAYSFNISLSGTRGDEFVSQDGNSWNANWNPVWKGATARNEKGWTAEMMIPLSQLRFNGEASQTWGLQVLRRIYRLEERSSWQRISKESQGWVSQFGELRGLKNLKPKRTMEFLPYVVGGLDRGLAEPEDPFNDGEETIFEVGLDGKIGITNNLTLDFTLNPDFGQVEADPSEVNLTSFETFFSEKRPFFMEGSDIFHYRLTPAQTGGSFTSDSLFYSRRIGRRPGYSPSADFRDAPKRTRIIGAFKLTGKTKNGLSIGILDSVTAEEDARLSIDGVKSRSTIEPLTNYFAGRLQKDFHNGDTQIGGMITAVNRDIEDPHLEFMTEEAYAVGLDFSAYFKDRDYRLEANVLGSNLRGSEEAIGRVQNSSARYFQRPDNENATYNPNRTSLSGNGGSIRFSRTNNFDLRYETGVAWRSPGFEINDLGFMRNADQINQFTWVGYRKPHPFSVFENLSINANQWLDWDTGGNFLGAKANMNTHMTFRNKYSLSVGVTRTWEYTSNTELRGGPASVWPGNWNINMSASSDSRKKFYGSAGGNLTLGDSGSGDRDNIWLDFVLQATDAINMSISPSLSHNKPEMQYVGVTQFGEEARYLFGNLDQETASLTFRLNYAITANLTVQYYGSPFISKGRYNQFKHVISPKADAYRDRFHVFATDQVSHRPDSETYYIDENGDGDEDYHFGNPDFDVREFNSNLVLRWEFNPGSTIFLVWSQARSNYNSLGQELDYQEDLDQLFSSHPDNVVLLKISKWFSPR